MFEPATFPAARSRVLLGATFAMLSFAQPGRSEPAPLDKATPAPIAASAAPTPTGPLVPTFAPDARLLQAFGGKPGIFKLAEVFVDRMRADARIGHYFEKTKLPLLKTQLGDQLCQVLAGPCVYDGDTMKAAHAELKISRADSYAQIEILQASMDSLGIAFSDQNKLLARLAPMYRDIITR